MFKGTQSSRFRRTRDRAKRVVWSNHDRGYSFRAAAQARRV